MLGLTTVAKYKSLERRVKELENLNSSLLEDKARKTNRIEKLENQKRDLIEENSALKLTIQEVNEFNLKLQETLNELNKKCESLESSLKELESGLQRQVNEYDKAIKTISELTDKVSEQEGQIEALKIQLNSKEEKTPIIKKPITPIKRRTSVKIPKRKVVAKAEAANSKKKKASTKAKKQ